MIIYAKICDNCTYLLKLFEYLICPLFCNSVELIIKQLFCVIYFVSLHNSVEYNGLQQKYWKKVAAMKVDQTLVLVAATIVITMKVSLSSLTVYI